MASSSFSPRKKFKKIDSAQQPGEEVKEEEQPQNNGQSQEDSTNAAAEDEEEVNIQVQMGDDDDDDIHREKKNLDAAEIATNDHSQPAVKKELGSAEEEEEEEEEREIKKLVDVLHISIQSEKKNLSGRTFSRHVRTQEYLDSLIRGHDPNLEDGLSRAMRDFLGEYTQYPDADFDSLVNFVTGFLELIDVPSQDLVNLRHIIANNFQAATKETSIMEKFGYNFQAFPNEANMEEIDFWDQNPMMSDISDYKPNF